MSTKPSQTVARSFHRNKVTAVEEAFRGQKLHGRRRTWHRNGQLAMEEFYSDGLLHGVVRQWNDKGRLLGSFRMKHGTGIQKSWHDNGRLNQKFTTIAGEFCGRSRKWLRDGTLILDHVVLSGRPVTRAEYYRATLNEPRLPKLQGWPGKLPPRNRTMEKHIQYVFVQGLLSKRNRSEARAWLKAGGKTMRSPGHFKNKNDALKCVEELYRAGAVKVIAPDIYQNKRGDQFTDYLLVHLPKARTGRMAIRKVCKELERHKLGAIEPNRDISEEYLILSMP